MEISEGHLVKTLNEITLNYYDMLHSNVPRTDKLNQYTLISKKIDQVNESINKLSDPQTYENGSLSQPSKTDDLINFLHSPGISYHQIRMIVHALQSSLDNIPNGVSIVDNIEQDIIVEHVAIHDVDDSSRYPCQLVDTPHANMHPLGISDENDIYD